MTTTERDFKKGIDLYPEAETRNHAWDFMVFEALPDVKAPNNSPSDLTVEAEVDMQELMDSVAVVQ